MRIGILPPYVNMAGQILDAADVAERFQMIESAGLDSLWVSDRLPLPGHPRDDGPDPFAYLTIASLVTHRIEIGTAIHIVPLRNNYDSAQRMYTLQTFAPGRVTIGVGTGSQSREYQAAGVEWEDRFKLLESGMLAIRQVFEGQPVAKLEELFELKAKELGTENAYSHWVGGAFGDDDPWVTESPWATKVGTPRFVLGAWHGDVQLRRAATQYQGWMASGGAGAMFGGWVKMRDVIKRYREFGGKRALMTSVDVDLSMPSAPLPDDGSFHLRCSPDVAAERLHLLEEIGFDDVIVSLSNHRSEVLPGPRQYDFTVETLEQLRALLPKDPRNYSKT
jgi:alkanesulfonate monooxygenase SsuD/methylene tetrahydromethanopterin reductase-like flavin-dependent oxidoreductase (luciferase family)